MRKRLLAWLMVAVMGLGQTIPTNVYAQEATAPVASEQSVAGQSNTVKVVKLPEGATITYSTSAKGSYVATAPSYSVAGTYKVYYKVSKDNYQDVTGNVSIVVSKDAPVSPIPVRNITINAISDKIDAGKKLTLTASVFPENATNKKLMWTTSDRKVATVNSDGIVTANKKASGKSAIITATAADGSGVKADYVITVK